MESKIKIGFVILVWNSEKVIEACLRSLLNLKDISPTVIIIDNGSTDSTPDIVNAYIKAFAGKLEVIRFQENMGTTVSRNAGLKKLADKNLDYYCVLDSDTVVNDAAFTKLVEEMNTHIEYGMIGPKLITSSGLVQMSARAFPTVLEKLYKGIPIESVQKKGEEMEIQTPNNDDADSYPVDYLMSACWLLRPAVVEAVGLLDEKIFYAPEDAEYCIRIWKSGYKVAYCPTVQIIHEWQRISKKKLISKMNWEHIKGLAYMFRKHKYLLTSDRLKNSFPIER